MAKQRRGVKFNHRNGLSSSADGRKSSFSDISEGTSETGSPTRAGSGDGTTEVRSQHP
jgi:phosphatidate cytidylyltransferase